MSEKQTQVASYLEKLSPAQLVADEKVKEKFVQLYNAIHGTSMGESMYHKEQFNIMKIINETPVLQECTKLSLYGCFLDISVMGLSLDSGSKPLAYITSRNAKVKVNGIDVWEKRASITVSPYGELVMRIRAGQIKNADNPVIVYDGDKINVGLNDQGHKVVKNYDAQIPRKENAKIIGGFIRIERHGGAFENTWVDVSEMDRLKGYSARNNSKYVDNGNGGKKRVDGDANALFTSFNGQIDPGFFEAKIIKHAFRSYPKVRTGEFTQLASQEELVEEPINYNLNSIPENTAARKTQNANADKYEAFGKTEEAETVTVVIQDDSDAF